LRLAISLLIVDLFSFRKDNAIHEFWGIFLSLYQPHLSADPRIASGLVTGRDCARRISTGDHPRDFSSAETKKTNQTNTSQFD
ncbi:MAG: hypothetical protein M0P12_13360, partial [Paludibacteraceae bacterium]|nr:hypothetical protein [Paludibacteraceae bacterium]